ncbi:MAG: hypothetical protein ACFCUJ_02955 [Thiotrichales bacterium]
MISSRSRWIRLIALLLLALVGLSACVSPQLYRPRTVEPVAEGGIRDRVCEASPAELCADSALVHRRFRYQDKPYDYYMGFVEFDDQGWFWDRKQMEALLRLLHEQQATQKKEFLIILYAHGWQHNADACDNNVVCFQRVLERFKVLESQGRGAPRTVVGVYVGWRGRSLSQDLSILDKLTFWQRKNSAQRVGNGGVIQLLSALDEFRRYKNPDREHTKTQFLIAGHSFGGKVVYSAIKSQLVANATRMQPENGRPIYPATNGIGDLVVLVNPAFEGSLYEPLHDAAANRCFPEEQQPALLVVTSETDQATRMAFPIGRWFNTRFQAISAQRSGPEQGEAIVKTVGHLDRYRTHTLSLLDPSQDRHEKGDGDAECGCPLLSPIGAYDVDADTAFIRQLDQDARAKTDRRGMQYRLTDERPDEHEYRYGDNLLLTRETPAANDPEQINRSGEYAPNHPYLVIRARKELIRDHGDIYDEDFVDFVRRFYLRHINERVNFPAACYRDVPACVPTEVTPCERSCRRLDGASCSGRPDG